MGSRGLGVFLLQLAGTAVGSRAGRQNRCASTSRRVDAFCMSYSGFAPPLAHRGSKYRDGGVPYTNGETEDTLSLSCSHEAGWHCHESSSACRSRGRVILVIIGHYRSSQAKQNDSLRNGVLRELLTVTRMSRAFSITDGCLKPRSKGDRGVVRSWECWLWLAICC